MVNFMKKHWTWISGLLALIANYSVPAASAFLAAELGTHPGAKIVFIAFLSWLGQISPSPLVSATLKRMGSISVALLLSLCLVVSGCSLAAGLTEAENIVKLIAPLGDGALAIVQLADPAIAPAVQAAAKDYDAAVPALETALSNWAAASASAQPTAFSQVEAAMTALQKSASGIISAIPINSTAASVANDLTDAISEEVNSLASVIEQIQAGGGTTAAMQKVLDGYEYQVAATAPHTGKVSLKTHKRAKQLRNQLVKALSKPTGNPKVDAVRAHEAAQLKALALK